MFVRSFFLFSAHYLKLQQVKQTSNSCFKNSLCEHWLIGNSPIKKNLCIFFILMNDMHVLSFIFVILHISRDRKGGRGFKCTFYTFQLDHCRQRNRPPDGAMDRWSDRQRGEQSLFKSSWAATENAVVNFCPLRFLNALEVVNFLATYRAVSRVLLT